MPRGYVMSVEVGEEHAHDHDRAHDCRDEQRRRRHAVTGWLGVAVLDDGSLFVGGDRRVAVLGVCPLYHAGVWCLDSLDASEAARAAGRRHVPSVRPVCNHQCNVDLSAPLGTAPPELAAARRTSDPGHRRVDASLLDPTLSRTFGRVSHWQGPSAIATDCMPSGTLQSAAVCHSNNYLCLALQLVALPLRPVYNNIMYSGICSGPCNARGGV